MIGEVIMGDTGEKRKGLTYAESGVDISKEGESIRSLLSSLSFKRKGMGAPAEIGVSYSGLVEFNDWYLSLCVDGVGSKIKIAESLMRWDTVGIDCIAMNVNDMICLGAEPLAFVDYIALESPTPEVLKEIGTGLNAGAEQANISIIGGETATLPDIIKGLDLAGTCLGVVRKDRLITGERVAPGDVLIGLPSAGIHSNGFSLVRRIVEESGLSLSSSLVEIEECRAWKEGEDHPGYRGEVERWISAEGSRMLGEILLAPTRIYVREIMSLLDGLPTGSVHGIAHITGGGFRNLSRLGSDVGFRIEYPLPVQPVFRMLQVLGGIEEREMYQTFNMGMGLAVVVDKDVADGAMGMLGPEGARIVGGVDDGGKVIVEGPGIEFKGYA